MIAAKLDRKLRDHILNSKDNLFSGNRAASAASATSSRPVLIIVDRNVDLVPMLSHSWTYQSLIHDVCSMHLNRITLERGSYLTIVENGYIMGVTRRKRANRIRKDGEQWFKVNFAS